MLEADTLAPDTADKRVYHAQLVTCLAVLPTIMGLTMLGTAASMGDREMRGELTAHPLAWAIALATVAVVILGWWLLGRRHRAGVILSGALFVWMTVAALSGTHRSLWTIAYAIAGLGLVVRAWPAMRKPVVPAP